MTPLQAIDPAAAEGRTKDLFAAVEAKMGKVPNMFKIMAASPAAAEAYLKFKEILATGVLDEKFREMIAIVCAETHFCQYCLSAHVMAGRKAGLSDDELNAARESRSNDPKIQAGLDFVRQLLLRRWELNPQEVEFLKEAGYNDAEIAEMIANVAINIYGNYFNLVAKPEVDFPKVELGFPF